MAILNGRQLAIRLQYEARRLGWQGLAGIGLLAASVATVFGAVLPQAGQLQLQESEAARLRQQAPLQRHDPARLSPQRALAAFYALLPDEHAAAAQLAVLLAAATGNDLTPEKAEYALARSPRANITRYEVTLPLRGSYVDIRKFVNQALNELPAAALDAISFQRDSADSSEVEARLRFTLYLRKEQP